MKLTACFGLPVSGDDVANRTRSRLEVLSKTAVGTTLLSVVVLLRTASALIFMFRRFAEYDDEGFVLISIKQYLAGSPLYDGVFSLYGPFFYLVAKGIHWVTGLEVGHDVGRLLTFMVWIAIASVLSFSAWRITRSYVFLIATVVLSCDGLSILAWEPSHPQGLCLLVASLILLVSVLCKSVRPTAPAVVMGALAGCLVMTKINIGAFAIVGLAFSLLTMTRGRLAATLAWACGGLAALLPALVMRSDLDTTYGRSFATILGVAILLVVVAALRCLRRAMIGWRTSFAAGCACLTTIALIGALTIAYGTSLSGLVNGVALQHLRFAKILNIRAPVGSSGLLMTVLSSVALAAVLMARRKAPEGTTLVLAGLKLLLCVSVLWFSLGDGRISELLNLVVPFLWVGLVPVEGDERHHDDDLALGRIVIVSVAALQVLGIYPVAGSHGRSATILILLVAALCARDLGSYVPSWLRDWRAQVVGWCLMGAVVVPWQWSIASWNIDVYCALVPLDLPHAQRINLRPTRVALYRFLAMNLGACKDTFLSLPGLNSLYFWSEKSPPTNQNTTHWMTLLDAATQREMIAQVSGRPELCAVRNQSLANWWVDGSDLSQFPLARYIDTEFRTIARTQGYELMIRRNRRDYELTYAVFRLGADPVRSPDGSRWVRWWLRLVLPALGPTPACRLAVFDDEDGQVVSETGDQSRATPLVVFRADGSGGPILAPGIHASIDLAAPRVLLLQATLPQPESVSSSSLVVLLFNREGGLIAPVPFVERPGSPAPGDR